MKKKIRIIAALFPLFFLGSTSCKDFLEEELVATLTEDYYKTEQGVEDLIEGAYEPVRHKFTYEWAYTLWNFGTDEFTHADQVNHNYYNTYDNRLNSNPPAPDNFIHETWTTLYFGINQANTGIEYIPQVVGVQTLVTPEAKARRMGELRFLRGLYFFQLVQQFGAIPMPLTSTKGVQTDFTRTPVPQVYQTIISDFKFAVDNLPATQTQFGRATKGAAQHFLAKAYLTRGSAITDQRGQKPTDIDSAAFYADQVIASGSYALEANYGRLWDISSYANSASAQKSREIIFSAQWNNNTLLSGRFGNQTHMYFIMAYDQQPGMVRDLANGRPFRRAMPTDYSMDIYDRKNDSRFHKSFQLAYISNTATSIPKWTPANAPTPNLANQPRWAVGDTAFYVMVNSRNNPVSQAEINRTRYNLYPRYYTNAAGALTSSFATRAIFPTLVKYVDPFRQNVAAQQGVKDGILARLGETYLIAAEAYGRKGNYAKALEYINVIRQRASYKAGEVKRPEYWKVEGGDRNNTSSTYPEITAKAELFTTNAASEMYPASVSSVEQRFIHFILNERSRELLGELHRWEDLARTETLLVRAKAFNPDAVNLQEFHKLRPIPIQHLERITNNGQPLSPAERQAQQNPGY